MLLLDPKQCFREKDLSVLSIPLYEQFVHLPCHILISYLPAQLPEFPRTHYFLAVLTKLLSFSIIQKHPHLRDIILCFCQQYKV